MYVCPRAFRGAHQIPLSNPRHFEEPVHWATCSPLRKPLVGWGQSQGLFSFAHHLLTTKPYILQTFECLCRTRGFLRAVFPVDTSQRPQGRLLLFAPLSPLDQKPRAPNSPASPRVLKGGSRRCEAGPRRAGFFSNERIPIQPVPCATSKPHLLDQYQWDRLDEHLPMSTNPRIFRG